MRYQVLAVLIILTHSTAAIFIRSYWGLEKEALIVRCSRRGGSKYLVDWYYSKTNRSVTTQKSNRVFASGEYLKFLPSEVNDTGIYTCIVRRPNSKESSKTGYVNITIYKKQPDCIIPDNQKYDTKNGSEKDPRIFCPTIGNYNWTAPVEWFKNCKALRGSRYHIYQTYLLIEDVTPKDAGDYTCKFMHNENGASYSVTATRSFIVKDVEGFILSPEIIAPLQNKTQEVEIGKAVNITCSACFGKGPQPNIIVLWQVNGRNVAYTGEARIQQIQQKHEINQSSSNNLTCLSTMLRITEVKEEDLSLKFECLAHNLHGLSTRNIRLRRKIPIEHQNIYYIIIGLSILLMLINIFVIMLKVFWIEVILLWRDIISPYKTKNDGKIYDAYIIYPRDDISSEGASSVECFVHQTLPDVLENKCGYNLCIYGRDLLPGEDVATAVESNIRKSRRHIFILTPQISHSKEFAYEQEIALHSALIQNDSKVILIEMEAQNEPGGLQLGQLQDSLKHLMKVQGTIKWREGHITDKSSLNSKFWKHVRYHMPAPKKHPPKPSNVVSLSSQWQ